MDENLSLWTGPDLGLSPLQLTLLKTQALRKFWIPKEDVNNIIPLLFYAVLDIQHIHLVANKMLPNVPV